MPERSAKLRQAPTPAEHDDESANGTSPDAISPNTSWAKLVPPEQWETYVSAIEALSTAGVRSMIGGAFGLACYTGRWRNTKDLDFYILPNQREMAIEALRTAGLSDYYDKLSYDRRWIYRSEREGVIVDVIWSMANLRADVEVDWFEYSLPVNLRGQNVRLIGAEELFWCKLYVLQRDRCDWPDLINLIYAVGPRLDWERLLRRTGDDRSLLAGLVSVFKWVSPHKAALLPDIVKTLQLGLFESSANGEVERERVTLLDSRPWFAAYQSPEEPLKL